MSYVDQNRGPSATGIASAVIVQAAIGALIVTGLTVTQIAQQEDEEFVGIDLRDPPPPPPPPPPPEQSNTVPETTVTPQVHTPTPKFELDTAKPKFETTPFVLPPTPPLPPRPGPTVEKPAPAATFTPVGAKPRNDPGGWLSDRDYRSSWARRELTGVASFKLDISANGSVTGCRITGSTGHAPLDEATCSLVQRRAKFEPARGSNGEPVAGQYSGSVSWQLPE